MDRHSILPSLRQCLGIGTSECRVQQCIFAGEFVVWNDRVPDIMPCHEIRRHVRRAGQRVGCRGDSPPAPEEHLMIVFHDLLLWDEHVTLTHTHAQRRRKLLELVSPIRGLVAIGHRTWLDLATRAVCLV